MEKKYGLWADLTINQVNLIDDPVYRREVNKKIRDCVVKVVNPLYTPLIKKRFKFSVKDSDLTCRIMITELREYYYSRNVTREELLDQINNWHKRK